MARIMGHGEEARDELDHIFASGLIHRFFINRRRKREGRPPIRGRG